MLKARTHMLRALTQMLKARTQMLIVRTQMLKARRMKMLQLLTLLWHPLLRKKCRGRNYTNSYCRIAKNGFRLRIWQN